MDTGTILIGFGGFVLLVMIYVLYRLFTDPPAPLDERSVRIARALGQPKFLDPVFAKPLTSREKIGWCVVVLLMVAAVVFSFYTGI